MAAAAPTLAGPSAAGSMPVTLYYGSEDGAWLVPVERAVPQAEGVLAQGRQIVAAQLATAPEGLISVIPPGTGLRGVYLTERAEAFVDLSAEAATAHPGGALSEQLTVYAVVNALLTNIAEIQRVQILIGGREVDSLAGHLDLRRPLEADLTLVRNTALN